MKIGYVASHLYRHTFEINEVAELLRQRPDTRIYSFYRATGEEIQRERIAEVPVDVVTWNARSVLSSIAHLKLHHMRGYLRAFFALAAHSLPNPIYWFKNFAIFLVACPILVDAKRTGVTHLHANFGSAPATIAWLGKRMFGMTMSITFHAFDIYSTSYALRDPLKPQKLRDAELVVSVHEDGRRTLQQLVPDVDPAKFHVIRINVVFDAREKRIAPDQPPLVLAAGNLVPKKGFGTLIEAVAHLKRTGFPVRLRILGEGPERRRLEQLVREKAVRDRVELPGYYQHRRLAEHLAEATAFVMPSRVMPEGQRDGIPTVVVESWLSGTPVVASLVGGMGEVIVDRETGLVFRPADVEGLASAIQELLASADLQKELAVNGEHIAREKFSPERNVTKLVTAIAERTGQA